MNLCTGPLARASRLSAEGAQSWMAGWTTLRVTHAPTHGPSAARKLHRAPPHLKKRAPPDCSWVEARRLAALHRQDERSSKARRYLPLTASGSSRDGPSGLATIAALLRRWIARPAAPWALLRALHGPFPGASPSPRGLGPHTASLRRARIAEGEPRNKEKKEKGKKKTAKPYSSPRRQIQNQADNGGPHSLK
jgi:hypothetical protein